MPELTYGEILLRLVCAIESRTNAPNDSQYIVDYASSQAYKVIAEIDRDARLEKKLREGELIKR